MVTRRELLRGAGALAAGALATGLSPAVASRASAGPRTETMTLTAPAEPQGFYVYLPFDVPGGVRRIEAKTTNRAGTSTGLGLFDQRGPQYGSEGFRGVYGAELTEFFVAADTASRAFLPGPIEPGRWTVIVPMFGQPSGNRIAVEVTLVYGRQPPAFQPGPPVGVVRDETGWYRGDLHCHTPQSSDAFASGTAMGPAQWADECRRIGLDFVSLTDHNVVSQNLRLARDAGTDVLLMPGEEMTNWFHGHATVAGLPVGEWLDWRQRPSGIPLQEHEKRITAFVRTARELGTYASIAHPLLAQLTWQFFEDAAANPDDPDYVPDGIEVWTSQFQPDDEAALDTWDQLLQTGRRIFANGGSDLHGVVNDQFGMFAGTPTTVVYADRLATDDVVGALRSGRSFVTRAPNGGEVYLTAEGPDDQRVITGGTVYGGATETVHVEALVRRGALLSADNLALRLVLIRDGQQVSATPITDEVQTVTADMPIGPGGYVRAELRSLPEPRDPVTAGRLDMEAFTNPVFLSTEPAPDDLSPQFAPPPAYAPDRVRRHGRHIQQTGDGSRGTTDDLGTARSSTGSPNHPCSSCGHVLDPAGLERLKARARIIA